MPRALLAILFAVPAVIMGLGADGDPTAVAAMVSLLESSDA
jgi:hypothetical protein